MGDNVGKKLDDLGYGDAFPDMIQFQKIQSMKKKNDKLDFIKIKNFCSGKDNIKRKTSHRWKEMFAKDTSGKEL